MVHQPEDPAEVETESVVLPGEEDLWSGADAAKHRGILRRLVVGAGAAVTVGRGYLVGFEGANRARETRREAAASCARHGRKRPAC